jgi:hypothetical protein
LAVAESFLHAAPGRDFILRDCLAPLLDDYEFILVDCVPTINVLVINALAAADYVLIPVQTDYLATLGLAQILQTVATVHQRLNPQLEVLGVLMTMVDVRTTHSREVINAIHRSLDGKIRIFDTLVRHQVGFKESSKAGVSVLHSDPKSPSAEAYRRLAAEVVTALENADHPTPFRIESAREPDFIIKEAAAIALAEAERLQSQAVAAEAEQIPLLEEPSATQDTPVASGAPGAIAAGACPFLGLGSGQANRQNGDTRQCFAGELPRPIDSATQRQTCLHSWHRSCSSYVRHEQEETQQQEQARRQQQPTSLTGRLRSLFRPQPDQ